jgi:hypothetical protein
VYFTLRESSKRVTLLTIAIIQPHLETTGKL